jgi:ribosomal protein S12 methylthiotransferase accessory factor
VTPSDTLKRYRHGTHRTRTPEETWSWLAPRLHRAGVTRLADVTRLDRLGIPVFQAVRPTSRNLCLSQGKALTPAGAKVSAAMEAVELWHAESLDHLPREVTTLRAMETANPIPQEAFPWRPDSRRFDNAPLPWVRADSLLGGPPGWLLTALLEINFDLPHRLQPTMFHVTSNGLASGNCLEEAQGHALCEVIERHGLYLARKAEGRMIPLDPASVESPPLVALLRRVRAAGMKIALYDITWEVGVPVLIADLVAPDLPNVWRGCGCHPDPDIALSRALTEAAQARLTYIAGARDDLTRFIARVHPAECFEDFAPPTPERRFEALPNLATGDVARDLERVLNRMDDRGYHPYCVDITRPDLGVPVVMVFVPGFREAAYG